MGCIYYDSIIARRSKNPLHDVSLLYSYIKLIKNVRPCVVLTYTVKPNIYGGIACQLTHTPYIANVTGLGTSIENGGLLKEFVLRLYKIGLRKANCVFFQNTENKQLFEESRIFNGLSRLISGSGVNLAKHYCEDYPDEDTPVRFAFLGRIMRDKGINELLQAASIIKRKNPTVQFDLIGCFDENYQETIKIYSNKGIINYLGSQINVHPFYTQSWAVVMPSYHEGMSNVCLEAASTGRPVLAANIPGCRETFKEGVSGIGFAPRSTEALINAINRFLSLSYEEKAAMGQAGRIKMEREFDRQKVVDAYMEEINNIVKR
jgi:galacturonosyltransferase